MTPDSIYEDLADRLATARTRCLMGEHAEARQMLQQARMDYLRRREELPVTVCRLAMVKSIEVAGEVMKI